MDTGTIKLGTNKELSRKVPPSILLEGFFYGGGKVQGCKRAAVTSQSVGNVSVSPPVPNFSDNFLPVMNCQPYLARVVSLWEKVLRCTGWNRATPRLRHGCCFIRGHHAGTALFEMEQRRPLATPTSVNNYCIG